MAVAARGRQCCRHLRGIAEGFEDNDMAVRLGLRASEATAWLFVLAVRSGVWRDDVRGWREGRATAQLALRGAERSSMACHVRRSRCGCCGDVVRGAGVHALCTAVLGVDVVQGSSAMRQRSQAEVRRLAWVGSCAGIGGRCTLDGVQRHAQYWRAGAVVRCQGRAAETASAGGEHEWIPLWIGTTREAEKARTKRAPAKHAPGHAAQQQQPPDPPHQESHTPRCAHDGCET